MSTSWLSRLTFRSKKKSCSTLQSVSQQTLAQNEHEDKALNNNVQRHDHDVDEMGCKRESNQGLLIELGSSSSPTTSSEESRRDATVLVLLDGDADFFNMRLLGENYHGGRKSAIELHNQVERWVKQEKGVDNLKILIMMFCNMQGLGNYLAQHDGYRGSLHAFAQGFNSSPFLCCMLDTGIKKQSADEALKKQLAFHIDSCDYLLLGGTHDSGYSDTLHQMSPQARSKVTLVRTTPYMARALSDMDLGECKFEGLFDGRGPMIPANSQFVKKELQRASFTRTSPSSPSRQSIPLANHKRSNSDSSESTLPSKKAYAGAVNSSPPASPSSSPPSPLRQVSQSSSNGLGINLLPAFAPVPPVGVFPGAFPPLTPTGPPTPPIPGTAISQPIPVPVPQQFQLLVNVLLQVRNSGQRRPLRSQIGGMLGGNKELWKHYPSFKEYVKAAEQAGVVRIGDGKTVGAEWIELVHHPYAATPQQQHFLPLVNILRELSKRGNRRPNCGLVGEKLLSRWSNIYQTLSPLGIFSFKSYALKARAQGIVELGGADLEWIKLTKAYE